MIYVVLHSNIFLPALRQAQDGRQHWYFPIFSVSVFALYERKNRNTKEDKVPRFLSGGALWAKGCRRLDR